ncbi:MAG: signal peptidase II [Endozoicomonadaceae bacterium]|nr:signal peptidase II [Endozoicomonadaceae bacterium]MCY4329951.1 signal peptidase II [Endozoicomonadaceae bacterium]
MLKYNLRAFRWLWITTVILFADQICKYIASVHLRLHEHKFVTSWLDFTLLHNKGAAFSFLNTASGWQRWFFIIIAFLVSFLLLSWMRHSPKQHIIKPVAAAMVLGGAIGNLLDRIIHGHVIDFILFHYENWYFPAFNIADVAITTGAILLVLKITFEK